MIKQKSTNNLYMNKKNTCNEKRFDKKELARFITKWQMMLMKTRIQCPKCKRSIKKFRGFMKGSCPYCGCELKYSKDRV